MLDLKSIAIGLLAIASTLQAAPPDNLRAQGIAKFNIAYKAWDGAQFASAAQLLRSATRALPSDTISFYWLGVAEFHRMLWLKNRTGSAANKADTDAALESSVTALLEAVKLDEHHAESHALLATLYGLKINGSLFQGMKYGPRITRHQELSLKYGPANPRVYYLLGMCQFHTASEPDEWQQASQTLLKAQKLFETEAKAPAEPMHPRWGYDSCLTFLGLACEQLGQLEKSAEFFRSALRERPEDRLATEGLKRVTKAK